MKTGNPALSERTFASAGTLPGEATMTLSGTVDKTGFLLVCAALTAAWTWSRAFAGQGVGGLMALGAAGGFLVALATAFRRDWAPVTAPLYAALEGLFLGATSARLEARFPGIAIQAVGLTFGVAFGLLALYRSGLVRPTENFKLGVGAATLGIFLLYLGQVVLSFLGASLPFLHESGPVGIAFSLAVTAVAAFNLVLDFDFIEAGVARGAPKRMEWYGAFGLMVTLVWLYLELLRLLAKGRGRRS